VNICALIVIGVNDSNNWASIIALCVGFPFAVAGGVFFGRYVLLRIWGEGEIGEREESYILAKEKCGKKY
jgi:hypothetical protein